MKQRITRKMRIELKNTVNSLEELLIIIKQYFPNLLNWIDTLTDSRHQSYITHDLKSEKTNPVFDDERKLLSRMENDDKDQILYFIKDFKIPATNIAAETGIRNIKIKQKIGKFRSVSGADSYGVNRSCISIYKKNEVNVLEAIRRPFVNDTIII